MPRVENHETETHSRVIFEAAIVNHGDMLFRTISERDYGVDGVVELFSDGTPTGRMAYIQFKGTKYIIEKLKRTNEVSCSGISKSNLSYCRQINIPVMLVYVSKASGKFYYIDLQLIFQGKIEEIADNKSGTVRIPIENNSDHLERFVEIINSYYERTMNNITSERSSALTNNHDANIDGDIITTYEFKLHELPSDGEHRQVGANGAVLAVGNWVNWKLHDGTEYNILIKVTSGQLIHKPDCPEDPYDSTEDFQYERLEQYGWYLFDVFYY